MSPIEADDALRNAIIYFICEINYYFFLLGFIIRVAQHRHVGRVNLMAPRSKAYITKIVLQLIMMLTNIFKLVEL